MSAANFIGRLGPLAAALGIGAVLAVGTAAVASADPAEPPDSTASATANASPAKGSASRAAERGGGRETARPAADRQVLHASPNESAPAAPAAATPAGVNPASRVAAGPSASQSTGLLSRLSALFNNQTPRMSPTQSAQSPAGVVTGSLNAVDPDSPRLAFTVTSQPERGTAAVAADGTWTYTPTPAALAAGVTDTFEVTVSDAPSGFAIHGLAGLIHLLSFGLFGSRGDTSTSTVTAVVTASGGSANTPPTGTFAITATNTTTGVVSGVVTGNDADGDSVSYSAPASTAKGSVSINASSGAFSYTPTPAARTAAAATGATAADLQDTFSVTLTDSRGGTGAVAVVVAVTPATSTPPPPPPSGSLAAFPGAEGFGAYATGGRGGSVVYVTNLNTSGPGSLQWAIDQPGTKYILFKVSGLINDQIHLTNGNVTIAGQTSPGGITVRGFVTDETPYQDQTVRAPSDFAENWILQHIRIRPGTEGFSDDGLRLRYTRNAIVDHVSIGNAMDEAIEISYSNNITVQNTLLAETVGSHSLYGGILMNYSNPANGFGLDNVSLHHNVFNRIEGRLPEGSRESLAAANSTMNLELSNNLYYDPNFFVALGLSTGVVTDGSGNPYPIYWNLNAVNNYFQTRSGFPYGMFDDQFLQRSGNRLYVSGNRMNLYPTRSDYELFYCCNDYASLSDSDVAAYVANQRSQKLPTRLPFPTITYTPTDQLRTVLLGTAGAWPRDPMDTRLMGSVASNTIATAPRNTNPAGDALLPAYSGAAPAAPADADNDGMPDSWESANGLNPNVANTNAYTLSTSYPDIEVYLQALSAARIAGSSL